MFAVQGSSMSVTSPEEGGESLVTNNNNAVSRHTSLLQMLRTVQIDEYNSIIIRKSDG